MTAVLRRAWIGEERLSIVFWYWAFLGSIAAGLALAFASRVADTAGTKPIGAAITLGVVVVSVAYYTFVAVAMWRCAPNVRRPIWRTIGRVYAVAQAGLMLYWLYEVALWLAE